MSDENLNGAGGADDGASGDGGNGADEMVTRSAYNKAVGQRKADQANLRAVQAELDAIKLAQKEQTDAGLIEQNNYKALYETLSADHKALKEDFGGLNDSIVRAEKFNAFEKAAGHSLRHDDFARHIDFDSIQLTDDREIDEESLNLVVGKFKKTYGDSLFNINKANVLPDGSGSTGRRTAKGLKELTDAELDARLKAL